MKIYEDKVKVTKELKKLNIRKSLPQIIVPCNKVDMFIDWWNTDIRFQDEIPHSFEQGYLILENELWKPDGEKVEKVLQVITDAMWKQHLSKQQTLYVYQEMKAQLQKFTGNKERQAFYKLLKNRYESVVEDELPDTPQEFLDYTNRLLYKYSTFSTRSKYREYVKNKWNDFVSITKNITMYFKFISDNSAHIYLYGADNELLSTLRFKYGKSEDSEIPDPCFEVHHEIDAKDFEDYQDKFNEVCLTLFVTSMWYIATTTKNTKYIYNKGYKPNEYKDMSKDIKPVKSYKEITTPVYDFRKVRVVSTDKLIQRRKGWTYSHSFQVHGHYRHYKNGKVIFIKSYIKGKEKELQSQVISLSPSEL